MNKQSIPPGHRRKSNMIIKSGHIEQPKVFLKTRKELFVGNKGKNHKRFTSRKGFFDKANMSYKSDEKTKKVVCFKGQIKL